MNISALQNPAFAVILGVLFALLYSIFETENPARIPLRKIAWRAAFGITMFIFLWSLVCYIVCSVCILKIEAIGFVKYGPWLFALLVGLFLPLSTGAFKALFTRGVLNKYKWLRQVLALFHSIDHVTRLYIGRIISREERKINLEFFREFPESGLLAVDRLFEFHVVEIAREKGSPGLTKVRNRDMKFKLVLRFLGHDVCLMHLRHLVEKPDLVFPTWPPILPDRRKENRKPNPGRRRTDQSYTIAYITDGFEGLGLDSVLRGGRESLATNRSGEDEDQ